MATATFNWSGRGKSEQTNGSGVDYTITREYTVVDATSEDEALAAVGLPVRGDPLVPGSPLLVKNREAFPKDGPTTWRVRIDYAIPPNGQWATDEVNPLQRPARISWGTAFKQVPMEVDRLGATVTNSAGDYFDPLPTRDVEIETLSIRRWEPFYDRAKARTYRNRVNSNNFTVGNTTLYPFECKCVRIGPTQEFEANAPYVEIEYAFEIDIDSRAEPNQSGYPFDVHLVDRGTNGWYLDTQDSNRKKKGVFATYRLNGSAREIISILTEPILLDGTGKPLQQSNDQTRIGVAAAPDLASPVYEPAAAPSFWAMTTDRTSPFSSSDAKVWLFAATEAVDFSNILA